MLNNKYPPLISSSLPAIKAGISELKLYYKIPSMVNYSEVKDYQMQYLVSDQQTNISVLFYKEGSAKIFRAEQKQDEDKNFYIEIPGGNLNDGDGWISGKIYKIQIRFCTVDTTGQVDTVTDASEWSTVAYLKVTSSDAKVEFLNNSNSIQIVESPIFQAKYINEEDPTEIEKYYKFSLYNKNNNQLIEESNWLFHESGKPYDEYVFSKTLQNSQNYIVTYSIRTKNGLELSNSCEFLVFLGILENIEGLTIDYENDHEEGYILIDIESKDIESTNIVLRRTDIRSNYNIWEDYKIFNISNEKINIQFKDYFIEHGISYKYAVQTIDETGQRGDLIKSVNNKPVLADFEYTFLVDKDGQQLKIKYDSNITSWKRNLLENKIDTLGSKYPYIMRNGAVNYFTFPLGGLISYHLDEAEEFVKKQELVRAAKYLGENTAERSPQFSYNNYITDITSDNITIEREFRNKVEEFLTNGNIKFFKSPTEGSKLITLTGVSLTPNKSLSRMIYSFSSTAYEVGETGITNLIEKNIIDKGEVWSNERMTETPISGAVTLEVEYGQNIFSLIQGEISKLYGERKILYFTTLNIEVHSKEDFKFKIIQNFSEMGKNEENRNYTELLIGDLKYYSLEEVIKIYDIIALENGNITIDYKVILESIISSNNIKDSKIVSNFYQLYKISYSSQEEKSLISILENQENSNFNKVYNINYVLIESTPGVKFNIYDTPKRNNNPKTIIIGETGSIEYRDCIIYDIEFIDSCVATFTMNLITNYTGGEQA